MTDRSICQDLIGIPFADLGRGPDAYDCWGLVVEVSRRLGKRLPDYDDQFHHWQHDAICRECAAHMEDFDEVPPRDRQPGDLVLFNRITNGLHFGIVIDHLHLLHTSAGVGAERARIDGPVMRRLIKGFYRCRT